MESSYATVVDPLTVVPTALAMGIHLAVAAAQLVLGVVLLASGARGLLRGPVRTRAFGALRVALGALLLVPLALGSSSLLGMVGALGALALGTLTGANETPGEPGGGRVRQLSAVAGGLVALFAIWESEDALALSVALVTNMQEWRTHELDWQRTNDLEAPKVGDLAPDFELQDPSGASVVRLSDFRGKRPVALVFGSYT